MSSKKSRAASAKTVSVVKTATMEPEPEDGITGFNGSPERVFSSYNPIDDIDKFPT